MSRHGTLGRLSLDQSLMEVNGLSCDILNVFILCVFTLYTGFNPSLCSLNVSSLMIYFNRPYDLEGYFFKWSKIMTNIVFSYRFPTTWGSLSPHRVSLHLEHVVCSCLVWLGPSGDTVCEVWLLCSFSSLPWCSLPWPPVGGAVSPRLRCSSHPAQEAALSSALLYSC